jgi:glyoxylase-like metal-dependent hydrolase (beta-lactamase superfamily II)
MIRIHALQTGTVRIKTNQLRGQGQGVGRMLNTLTGSEWTPSLPIYAWAIEHPEGVIVVDTGETARTSEPGYFPRWHPFFRMATRLSVRPEDEIGLQLQHIGIEPREVRWVILTHLHTDHAGGLAHFPSAEILVSPGEYKQAHGLTGQVLGYLPQHWPSWFAPRFVKFAPRSVGPFSASYSLTRAGDVIVLPTPGHTPHHLSVLVHDGDVSYFLAGDTSYNEQLMLEGAVDGVSPNAQVARQTLSRIRSYAQETPLVYLPSHDPDSALRLATRTTVPLAVGVL